METDAPREPVRVHLVVELEQLGPVGKHRSTVVTALMKSLRATRLVWAGTDFKQTAYKVVSIEEEVATCGR
ncbi:hypothetical protein [Micromonospora sp. NPDC004551]|uniref:hypothetical protein n=1 Tax=Micromonospora sp. NPDC004551 TaxID=3154284 RepID=UPI0033B8CCBF